MDEAQAATMLTETLTLRGFDTAGAVCATGSVFGRLRRRGELTLPRNGQGFFVGVTNPDTRAAAPPWQQPQAANHFLYPLGSVAGNKPCP